MILISQLNYISGIYLPCKSSLEEVRKLIFQFIWGEGRREVIEELLTENLSLFATRIADTTFDIK